MRRRAAFFAALPFLLLAACSRQAPAPPPLPTLASDSLERDCACVERGDCAVPEAFEGQDETRNFQCRRDDRAGMTRATCTYESRFRQPGANTPWSSWARTTVRFRQARNEGGWCWDERSSDRVL